MQWVRRCRQEEMTLIEQFINEEDIKSELKELLSKNNLIGLDEKQLNEIERSEVNHILSSKTKEKDAMGSFLK